MSFKKDDVIKCIDGESKYITEGHGYIVVSCCKDFVYILNNFGEVAGYYPSRFNLVKTGTLSEDSTQEEKEASKVGLRFNTDKLPLDQIPPSMEKAFAEVARYGEKKYCKHNWRKGMDWSIPFACAKRHMVAWFNGEEVDNGGENPDDKGSGLPHLYHALWNIAALIEYQEKNVGKDDRWPNSDPLKEEK